MSCITTYTGRHFDPTAPDPECIDIRDIAHALSYTCRGNGHVQNFYSVGQHCIGCTAEAIARGLSTRVALMCLLHDASEAYMSDVPRPFKAYLSEYRILEDKLLAVIYAKYLPVPPKAEELSAVKQIDDDMLEYDLALLLKERPNGALPDMAAVHDRSFIPFERVEKKYLDLFGELYGHV